MPEKETTYASLSLTEEDHKNYKEAVDLFQFATKSGPFYPHTNVSDTNHFHESRNPSDPSQVIVKFRQANQEDVESAVRLGKNSASFLEDIGWKARQGMLRRAISLIEAHKYFIAAVMAFEAGKVRAEALAEINEVIAMIHFYISTDDLKFNYYSARLNESSLPPYERTRTVLRPLGGPVAVISPFNFPFALAANHTIRNFLNGNPVVLKPASDTPFSTYLFIQNLQSLTPRGTCSLVVGPGSTVGEQLLWHPDIKCIAFTGSLEVGKRIMQVHNELFQKNIFRAFPIMEMGGKNPTIVMESADIEAAAEGAIRSAVGHAGQKCSAVSRVLIHESVYDEFKDLLRHIAENGFSDGTKITIGLPWERETYLGPLINKAAFDRYHNIIGQLGGEAKIYPLSRPIPEVLKEKGYFVRPVAVEGIPHHHPLNKEEHFVPIVLLHKFSSLEEAVEKSNDVNYGLCAGIFTKDQGEIEYFLKQIQAGVVYVNRRAGSTTGSWPGRQSFGGWKGSGTSGRNSFGRWYALNFGKEQCQTDVLKP